MRTVSLNPVLPAHLDPMVRAIILAGAAHADQQFRPMEAANHTPFLSHSLGTMATVWQYGGTDFEATASPLHDLVEDQSRWWGGRQAALQMIRDDFGPDVADIVEGATDPDKPPELRTRMVHTKTVALVDPSVWLVKAADFLNNLSAVIACMITYGVHKTFRGFLATDPNRNVADQIRLFKTNSQKMLDALKEANKRFAMEGIDQEPVRVGYRTAILDALDSEMKRFNRLLRKQLRSNLIRRGKKVDVVC